MNLPKSINLLHHKEFDQTALGKFLRWSLTYGRYIIICTEIIVLLAFIYRFSLDRQITDLGEEIDQKSAIISANQIFEYQFRNLQDRVNHIGVLLKSQGTIVKILRIFEELTPSGIKFISFSYTGNVVEINATAVTNAQLAQFLQNLRSSSQFTDINVSTISKESSANNAITFQLETTISESIDKEQAIKFDL